jgi:glycosyltransferase involved in cell wall biosynthesis
MEMGIKMEKGLVSVVIPTYNRAKTIERAVDSALDQDYPLIEVIVVDDGSQDDTADRIAKRYNQNQRVRYFRIPNGGVCVARNRGLREVRGEFVAMLDSDDYWLPGKLSLQVGILQAHPTLSMVWSDMDAIDITGQVVAKRYLRKMYGSYQHFPTALDLFETEWKTNGNVPYYIGNIAKALVIGNLVHTSTVVARADRLLKAGEYDQSVHPSEDQDYYYRVCLTGPVALIDTVTIHYQIGAADAASGDARYYEMATSSMMVFNRIRERVGKDLQIPQEIIEQKETDLYRWVGHASFHKGRITEARLHLMKRIMRFPFDKTSIIYLLLTCIPYSTHIFNLLHRARGIFFRLIIPMYLFSDIEYSDLALLFSLPI